MVNKLKSDLKIQIDVKDSFDYPKVAESIFGAILDWPDQTASSTEAMYIDLLVTDSPLLASQSYNGLSKTIILLTKNPRKAKSGIIISDGTDLYNIIIDLLNTALGIK